MATTTFYVEQNSTNNIQSLEEMLMQTPGIERALVDMDDGEVKLDYDDSEIKNEQITEKVEQYGFRIIQ